MSRRWNDVTARKKKEIFYEKKKNEESDIWNDEERFVFLVQQKHLRFFWFENKNKIARARLNHEIEL